jgi:predicted DCC family thiol-disulfide oxidoreductase YuxK
MTEITDNTVSRPERMPPNVIFYDGTCSFCSAAAARWRATLERRRFELRPLQSAGAAQRLRIREDQLLDEVKLLTADGRVLGGADAIVHVAWHLWWAWPIYLLSLLPGVRPLLRRAYRKFVPYRYCIVGRCGEISPARRAADALLAWLPLIVLPALALSVAEGLLPWAFMWLMAAAIFFGCKWLTWRTAPPHLRRANGRSLAYLLAWPGMDAARFLDASHNPLPPNRSEWLGTIAHISIGITLIWIVARLALPTSPLLAGWIGMIGLILLLHCGAFHVLSLIYRSAGVDAEPIMHRPTRAANPADFWGNRWNRGFSTLMRRFVQRPLQRRIGLAAALLFAFLVSGVLHELVITLPARGGWGGPTLYFLLQGIGVLALRFIANGGVFKRIATLVLVIAPLPLLFPSLFVQRVVLPFMQTTGAFDPPLQSINLATAILLAGLLHFGILIASALVPQVLDWRSEMRKLAPLSRHLVWTHGAFIVLTILGFGAVSMIAASELAVGTLLARTMCGFIAIFWLARLCLQFVLFDARPYLRTTLLKLGYHALTVVFSILVLTYSVAAFAPRARGATP